MLEDVEFMKIAKELGNEVVNFINTDLAELQKSAEEKSVQQLMKENCRMPKYFILARKES